MLFRSYSNMLVLHVPQTLKDTATNSVAKVLRCRLRVNVAQVHSAIQTLGAEVVERVRRERQVRGERRRSKLSGIGVDRRQGGSRLRHKRLRGRRLRCLSSGLLRLRDVCTPILAIVDSLSGPGSFCRKSVDNLCHNMNIQFWSFIGVHIPW